jgi:putative ABC transport system permease protein
MSSFNPVQVLKGKIGISTGGVGFRKILLGFQFSISVILIFITLIIYLQTSSMLSKDLGIDINNTLIVKGSNLDGKDSAFVSEIESFKQSLKKIPEVESASNSNFIPANTGFTDCVCSDIQQPDEKHQFSVLYIDNNYLQGFKVKPIAGRLFSKDFPSDKQAAIISKSALSALGFKNAEEALNHKTNRDFGDKNKQIVGVIEDFQMGSWKDKSQPMIFYFNPGEKQYFVIKLNKPINQTIIAKIESSWKEFFGDEIFRHFDLKESYNDLYKLDVRNSKVLGIFAIIGILVACIGLWGLAFFTITNRTKEIGIRKVIGFTAIDIVGLINKDFLKLVVISSLIATPIAWWLGQTWLEDYADKINMSWWLAVIPLLLISTITVVTISFYTIKTALANPSKALRDE